VSPGEELRKFLERSQQERWLFLEACLLLGVMRAAILLLPFRRITAMMGLVQEEPGASAGCDPGVVPAMIGWAVKAASARTPWESACLAQALTAMAMLSRRGIDATLYLGVAKGGSLPASMDAHAWLDCGGSIIAGGAGVERYSAISRFTKTSGQKCVTVCSPPHDK
jgi:hypothetical protein